VVLRRVVQLARVTARGRFDRAAGGAGRDRAP
jgi:hypothetical protein